MNVHQIIKNAIAAVAENEPEMLERPVQDLLNDMAQYDADLEEYIEHLEQLIPVGKTIESLPEWQELIISVTLEVAKHI